MLYDGTEPTEPRAVLLGRLETAGGPIVVGTTHFPRSDEARRKHLSTRLLELLGEQSGPYVLCGDFNQAATDWITNGIAVVPSPQIPTYPTSDPREAIDYCLASDVEIGDARVLLSEASDHLAVLLTSGL